MNSGRLWVHFIFCAVFETRIIKGNNAYENDRERYTNVNVKSEVKGEKFESDYSSSSEYKIKTTFPPAPPKAASSSLKRKYEWEEEIVSSSCDSGTNERNTFVVKDKKCRICGVNFRFAIHYEKHFKDDHPDAKPYKCPDCPYEIRKRQTFIHHVTDAHPERVISYLRSEPNRLIKCETCRTKHYGIKNFQIHNATRHKGVKMFACGLCNVRFSLPGSLMRHEMVKHGMHHAEFQCKLCRKPLLRSDDAEIHGSKCRERQAMKKILINKISKNSVEREDDRIGCSECDEKFGTIELLKAHFQTTHPELKGCFLCKICRKRFTTMQNMNIHVDQFHADNYEPPKKRRNVRKYECQYCGESFGNLKAYEQHGIRAHKDCKFFTCADCGGGFNRKQTLQRHCFSFHNPIVLYKKLFRCDTCYREFDNKTNFNYHMKRKHAKADIPCPHCCKCFAIRHDMKVHAKGCGKRRADKSPRFFCGICQKTMHGSEKWHMQCHENYDYCIVCENRFHRIKNPRGLTKHMAKRHPDAVFSK